MFIRSILFSTSGNKVGVIFVTETRNNGGSNWSFKEVSSFISTAELGLETIGRFRVRWGWSTSIRVVFGNPDAESVRELGVEGI